MKPANICMLFCKTTLVVLQNNVHPIFDSTCSFLVKRKTKDNIKQCFSYSETFNKEYIERIHQMSYSLLSDNGMLQIFSFLVK